MKHMSVLSEPNVCSVIYGCSPVSFFRVLGREREGERKCLVCEKKLPPVFFSLNNWLFFTTVNFIITFVTRTPTDCFQNIACMFKECRSKIRVSHALSSLTGEKENNPYKQKKFFFFYLIEIKIIGTNLKVRSS